MTIVGTFPQTVGRYLIELYRYRCRESLNARNETFTDRIWLAFAGMSSLWLFQALGKDKTTLADRNTKF